LLTSFSLRHFHLRARFSILMSTHITHLRPRFLLSAAFSQYAPSTKKANSLSTLPLQKIVFVLCNLLTLGVGLWKCRSMGLLPTGTGDWLAFESRGVVR
jgi:hypothetical protein